MPTYQSFPTLIVFLNNTVVIIHSTLICPYRQVSNSIQSKEFKFFWSVCASLNINLYSSLPIQWCSHGVHWRYVISCCLPTIHKRKTIVLYDFLQLSKRHYLLYTVRWRYNQKQVFEYNKTLVHFLFSVSIWFTSIWYCPKSTWTLLEFFIVWHFWMLRHLVIFIPKKNPMMK